MAPRKVRLYDKPDAVTKGIVDGLRGVGATVNYIGRPVDLLVGFRGRTYIFEVKNPGDKLRPSQTEWAAGWKGQFRVVHTLEEALEGIHAI
jgi:hypothetical protein